MSAGILDTNVVILMAELDPTELPDEQAITTVTFGELCAGPSSTDDPDERDRRRVLLEQAQQTFAGAMFPYDEDAARRFGEVIGSERSRGRTSKTRSADYQIAAIAIARRLPLYTVNHGDFEGIEGLDLRRVTAPSTQPEVEESPSGKT